MRLVETLFYIVYAFNIYEYYAYMQITHEVDVRYWYGSIFYLCDIYYLSRNFAF